MLPPGITFTSPTGDTFTTGKRGKRPNWVATDPKYLQLVNSQVAPSNSKATPSNTTTLKCWRWADQLGDEGVKIKTAMCIVAANNPSEALELLKRRFPINPVSSAEFRLMWKPFDSNGSIQTPGVYEHNKEKVLTLKTT